MKQLNIRILLTVLLSIIGLNASAHDIEMQNKGKTIYYNYINNNTELSVTYRFFSYSDYSNEYTGNVVIPESVTYKGKTYKVTSIGSEAFRDCTGLTSVTIGNDVTEIGTSAFRDCTGLTSVTIGNGVTEIGTSAFRDCTGLTSVTIGEKVKWIGGYAFHDCTKLTSVTIPNSVISIGYEAFYGCSGLTTVTIGEKVTEIGTSAFFGCSGLTSVSIPKSVTNIGNSAFNGCSGLKSITIPKTVTSIGYHAFSNCSDLTSINVASGNTRYDSRDNCNAIIETAHNTLIVGCQSTIIPNSVTSIGESAFSGCSGLTSFDIPNSVTWIGSDAFYRCSGLTSITIPNSVKSIGNTAFWGCSSLTSITILNSMTSIGGNVFFGCSGLKAVYNYATIPQTLEDDPQFNYSTATLHVPAGVKELYQAANYWKNFSKIVDDIPTAINNVERDVNVSLKVKSISSIDGRSLSLPQKGINIQKMSDGTARKVVID